jgi:cell division protein FtsQ
VIRGRSRRRSQRRLGTDYQTYSSQYHSTVATLRMQALPAFDTGRLSMVLAAGLLIVLGWALYSVFTSSSFYVSGVDVRGNVMVSADEIYSASQLEGMSIFWVDTEAVKSRIESLPDVKSASVHTTLPAGVTITIEERAPQRVWQSGDTTWWVDTEGIVMAPRGVLEGGIVITDDDGEAINAGDVIAESVLDSVEALHLLLPDLSEMLYSHQRGIGFRTGEGWPVYVGDASDMKSKLTVLKALRKQLLDQRFTPAFINLQYPQRPYYR